MYDYLKEEKIYEKNTFYEHIRKRKIGIWGCGSAFEKVRPWLKYLNLCDIAFFDNDIKKQNKDILPPVYIKENINENWFIVVTSIYYKEIKRELVQYGLEEYVDFIDGLDIENSIYSYKYRNNYVPEPSMQDILKIEHDMKKNGLNVVELNINMEKVKEFEQKIGFEDAYNKVNNKRYFRKILEYYISFNILNLKANDENKVYIDVGACSSPWVKFLRQGYNNKNAYAIDLEKDEKFSELNYYMIQDATHTEFEDNSIDLMSLQSAFEMFMGDSDIKFIKECSRILKPGGKVLILPLYMNLEYISTASPKYYKKGYSDSDSKEYVRFDDKEIRLGRLYDVKHLKERVLDTINENGMKYKIHSLSNEQVEKDGFVYLKFILEIEKL